MSLGFVRCKLPLRASLAFLIAFLIIFPYFNKSASAADFRFENFSFEHDLAGWTPMIDKDNGNDRDEKGSGARTTNEQFSDGQYSVRIDDAKKSRAVGLESGKLGVEAGAGYVAFADVRAERGTAELHIRFYDVGGQLLNEAHTTAEPAPAWRTIQVSMDAPAGAAYAAVLLHSGKENEGTAYWDNVRFTKDFTNLGAQVGTSAPLGSTFGKGENQNNIYSVVTGNATDLPIMQVIDADNESVSNAITLPDSNSNPTGVWGAATASDGTVYFGAYQNGRMYKYVPGDMNIADLGQPLPNQQFVWDLSAGKDGKVYGGTYDDAGFFQYDPSNGFTRIGSMPIYEAPGQNIQYVRALAHDVERNVSYLAVGANASVIRYDHTTGNKTDILPAKYKTTPLAGAVEFEGDRVFVSLGGYIVVLNVKVNPDGSVTSTEEAGISGTTPRVSPERNGGVYFIKGGKLARYNIASKTFTALAHSVPGRVQRFGWVTLKDQAGFPGETLVAVASTNNETYLMKYNPQNGSFRMVRVEGAPRIPGAINSIGTGPDGSIYTSAFQYGGLGVYRPFAGDSNDNQPEYVHAPINQIDKMASFNGKLYLGVYPGGTLFEYDPNRPWNAGVNPKTRISTSGYGQDRPKAIAYGDNRVFMGTTGITNERKGALSVFDFETGITTVHIDIVTDQSVTALVYHNGLLYGGSSIRGGYSSIPTQTEAKLFLYDPDTKTKIAELGLPAKNNGGKPTAITELEVVDGKIWGFAEGYLFVFNTENQTFEYFEEKFPDVHYPGGAYRDADLVTVDKDPNSVYGTIGNKYLFKINRTDKAVTILKSDGADMLTADHLGNLYFKHNDRELWRYSF